MLQLLNKGGSLYPPTYHNFIKEKNDNKRGLPFC